MAGVTAKAFRIIEPCKNAAASRPSLHGLEIVVNAVLTLQPRALAGVHREHLTL